MARFSCVERREPTEIVLWGQTQAIAVNDSREEESLLLVLLRDMSQVHIDDTIRDKW